MATIRARTHRSQDGKEAWKRPGSTEQTSGRVIAVSFALVILALTGCPQNPYLAPQNAPLWQQQQQPQLSAQMTELQRRVQLLDDNNRQLHTQLAQSEQQAQVYRGELDVVRQQLAATVRDLESARLASNDAQQKMQSMQASVAPRGNATLAANTSLRRIAETANLGGLKLEYEGDVAGFGFRRINCSSRGRHRCCLLRRRHSIRLCRRFPKRLRGSGLRLKGTRTDRPTYGGVFASAHQLTGGSSDGGI